MSTAGAGRIAQALADRVRLAMLERLMDGPAAVSELMLRTGEAQSNVSNHLAVLREAGIVSVTRRGRQRLYELSGPSVTHLVASLFAIRGPRRAPREQSPALARARTCYDHLAGRLGVAVFGALVAHRAILCSPVRRRGPVELGPRARTVFGRLGVDLDAVGGARRQLATACDDWTERRPHLGGALGAALWAQAQRRGWAIRRPGTRIVVVSERGQRYFARYLGVRLS